MPKSKIIRDLANSEVDTITALKRAKVLFSDIDDKDINNWINYEISGYPIDAKLPDYRITQGNLFGSYFKGSMSLQMKWPNVSIPLGKMPDDIRNDFLRLEFRESVYALKHIEKNLTDDKQLGRIIPADYFPIIANFNDDPYMIITSLKVITGKQFLTNIFSAIDNRLLDVLILLEKEFGSLDEFDPYVASKMSDDFHKITEKIILIIYNDKSVTIGNSNKINGSTIASSVKYN